MESRPCTTAIAVVTKMSILAYARHTPRCRWLEASGKAQSSKIASALLGQCNSIAISYIKGTVVSKNTLS
jgi:hypothetical protein